MTRSLGLKTGLVATLALAASLIPATSASAAHVQCGDVLTQDTTLDSDLVCAGDALAVRASGVTLDLAGHQIQGSGAVGGRGVVIHTVFPQPLELNDIEVRGGTIRGFSVGIDMDGATGTIVDDMVLKGNGIGVLCHYAAGCRIEDSVASNNGTGFSLNSVDQGCRPSSLVARNSVHDNGVGINLVGCATTVTHNRIRHNHTLGLRIDDHGAVEVSRNVIARNGTKGISVTYQATATIESNRIFGNGAEGVHIDGYAYGARGFVRDNRISRNGADGVLTSHDADVALERNRIDRNGDDGIDVDAGQISDCCNVAVTANSASFNRGLGIEASPGTIDGGGNRARRNGDPAQCVGVSCQ